MKKILILTLLLVFAFAFAVTAVDSTKPEDHNALWVHNHGQSAKKNKEDCLVCHEERVDCIGCHEDTKPRNHTMAWTNKNHGQEASWNKDSCQTCHRQDFCVECHETVQPLSHTSPIWHNGSSTVGSHCYVGCALPTGTWQNTPSKNCLVCHSTRPIIYSGSPHPMSQ